MKQISSSSLIQFTLLVVLMFAGTTVMGGKSKTDKKTTKTSTSTVLNQDQVKAVNDKIDQPAPSNSPSSSSRTGEQINWQVISGGATNGSSTNYGLMGTVGQTAVTPGSSASYQLFPGYWQNFSGGGCCDLAGDFNDDGNNDVSDLSGPFSLVAFMFLGGPPPPCPAEGDFNGDGNQDVSDLSGPTSMVAFMFLGGPPPVCGPE